MNVLYIAQFHEVCGYSHAAMGYLKSFTSNLPSNVNFKILSISLDPSKLQPIKYISKICKQDLELIDRFHIKDQESLKKFLDEGYICVWHMTSVMPIIEKRPGIGAYYNNLKCNLENIILGSEENFHILAWETDSLPGEYYEIIKNYNTKSVFAPSLWNVDTFSKSGFNSILLPHLIEESVIEPEKINIPNRKEKFMIFSVSEWTNRKNFKCLIRSYLMEFANHEDVLLVLKTSLPPGLEKQEFLEQFSYIKESIRTPGKEKPNIAIILDYLNDSKMKYLYESCDVFCLTSLGEGFSLPTSEAAIHRKPIICPKLGGHVDYLDENNKYFIDGIWDTVIDQPPYDNDGLWYVPTIISTRENLRKAYSDWKSGALIGEGIKNYESSKSERFGRKNISNVFFDSINIKKTHAPKIQVLKQKIKHKSLKQQMDYLENKYRNEECYILNCGPSLLDYDQSLLEEYLQDKLTFTIKQSYDLFSRVSDFHFFNCSNLPKRDSIYMPHYKNKKDTIFVASSNYEEFSRWSQMQTSDVFFKIPIRTEINNEFLVRTSKIDENLIKNNLTRPCGPGIMYETVLFMAIHLGVKKIKCLGWDLTQKIVSEDNYKHFYGTTKNLFNRGDILPWEIEETRKFSEIFYDWCKTNNLELELLSDKSSLSDKIPRTKLEL